MMNRLYINWKDCHHHGLAPIRAAYIHRSAARNCSIGHAVARSASRRTLRSTLEKGWDKRPPHPRRTRKGGPRSSSGVGRVQRRASAKAQRRVQASGRASPENIGTHRSPTGAITAPASTPGDRALRAAGIDLKGAVIPGPKHEKERSQSEGLYSLMHGPELSSDIASQAAEPSLRRVEYAHIGSLEWLVTDSIGSLILRQPNL